MRDDQMINHVKCGDEKEVVQEKRSAGPRRLDDDANASSVLPGEKRCDTPIAPGISRPAEESRMFTDPFEKNSNDLFRGITGTTGTPVGRGAYGGRQSSWPAVFFT